MRVVGEQRVVLSRVRIAHPVNQGEQDGLQPSGAGFRGGDEEDIGVMSLKVFLEWDNSFHESSGDPTPLVLMEVTWMPAFFSGHGGYVDVAAIFLGQFIFLQVLWRSRRSLN
jgi:hypothetical protein